MIAISIVSYNTSTLLKNLLEKLTNFKEAEIWVVDNNSSDNSVEMIKKNFPEINLIESDKNLGFAKGQNLALKKINKPLTLIINPDTILNSEDLVKMQEFMKNNPEIGVASCKIIDEKGNLSSNGGDLPFGLALLSWLFNFDFKGMPSFHRKDLAFYSSKNAGWVGGTFMWVKKEVFEKVGFFNENYFMYFEDVEFCNKAKKAGFKIGLNPEVEVTHLSGASSQNPRLTQWKGEMQGLMKFSRGFGALYAFYVGSLVRLALALRITAFAVSGKLDYSKNYFKVLLSL